ncbi:MAG: preprotein translocase subunit SecG [Cellvibrionaceae bacterium]|jgi:preprotein translocase subunit SecG
MENLVIFLHIVVALLIIVLILLQQGKGAEAGASFGSGASQTVFGSRGGGNFFAKFTAILAVVFFATSFSLTIIAKNKSDIVTIGKNAPAASEQPSSETSAVDSNEGEVSDVPSVGETNVSEVPGEVPASDR